MPKHAEPNARTVGGSRRGSSPSALDERRTRFAAIPVVPIGVASGFVAILCCAGPTLLALFGVVSAGTAVAWATNLYDGYAWLFRFAGLGTMAGLVWLAARRRGHCSVDGLRRLRGRLLAIAAVATGTYVGLYAITTWFGSHVLARSPPSEATQGLPRENRDGERELSRC